MPQIIKRVPELEHKINKSFTNTAKKNFEVEHTKLIFDKMQQLSLHNLHIHHTFIERFKLFMF